MKVLLITLVGLLATEAGAVEVSSLIREVSYSGGLEQPGMIADSRSSTEFGPFTEDLSDVVSAPPDAEAAAAVTQFSNVSVDSGRLAIVVDGDVSARAVALADGTIADAVARSRLALVFTTNETTQLQSTSSFLPASAPFSTDRASANRRPPTFQVFCYA